MTMEIIKTYTSNLDADTLFRAWISPNMTIAPVTKIECNAMVGGEMKLYSKTSDHDGEEGIMIGHFTKVEFGKQLVYSWHWQGSDETTLVNVEFSSESQNSGGGATVHIIHTGFTSDASRAMHDSGWDHYFKSLEEKIKQTGFGSAQAHR